MNTLTPGEPGYPEVHPEVPRAIDPLVVTEAASMSLYEPDKVTPLTLQSWHLASKGLAVLLMNPVKGWFRPRNNLRAWWTSSNIPMPQSNSHSWRITAPNGQPGTSS
jgi:hypothetical protein